MITYYDSTHLRFQNWQIYSDRGLVVDLGRDGRLRVERAVSNEWIGIFYKLVKIF